MDFARFRYYTALHHHANQKRYDAPVDPWNLLPIAPDDITYYNSEFRLYLGLGRAREATRTTPRTVTASARRGCTGVWRGGSSRAATGRRRHCPSEHVNGSRPARRSERQESVGVPRRPVRVRRRPIPLHRATATGRTRPQPTSGRPRTTPSRTATPTTSNPSWSSDGTARCLDGGLPSVRHRRRPRPRRHLGLRPLQTRPLLAGPRPDPWDARGGTPAGPASGPRPSRRRGPPGGVGGRPRVDGAPRASSREGTTVCGRDPAPCQRASQYTEVPCVMRFN